MGRFFFVFMFCFAMDPLRWYLNQSPSVLAVKSYVDDCTAIGDEHHDYPWLVSVHSLRCCTHSWFAND